VQHTETVPKNYYISVFPVSSSWEEGSGLDLDNYSDLGVTASYNISTGLTSSRGYGASWIARSSTDSAPNLWTQAGGDVIASYRSDFYLENGIEDIEIDVTKIIEDQLSNVIPRNGLLIALSSSYEDGSRQKTFYTKRFSARSSEYFYNKPIIEARWESLVQDNRQNFYFESVNLNSADNTQNIYFYNKVNGKLKDINGDPQVKVKILNSLSQSMITPVNATKISTGVYKASVIVTGSVDEELIDVWYSGSNAYYSGSIYASTREFENIQTEKEYIFSITNLKNTYKQYETPIFRVFARQKDWSPNIYHVSNSEIETKILNNLYYKIIRLIDQKDIIDYGISPISYTKCSFDSLGNYFDLDMSLLEPGYAYGIRLMITDGSEKSEISSIFKFKVE